MATIPTPEESARVILAIFVNHFKCRPGHVLSLSNFIAVSNEYGLHEDDFKPGMDCAADNGWIEILERGGEFRLTQTGFSEAPPFNLAEGKDRKMSDDERKLNVGDDSVVMGDVAGTVGHRSVVIGPTDNRGNVILNQSMAVGRNAHAGPGSIAIGANAGAGSEMAAIFREIGNIITASKDKALIEAFYNLSHELNNPTRDMSKISKLWDTIKTAAVLNGAVGLVSRATSVIHSFVKGS
jgi:hypothetical protein